MNAADMCPLAIIAAIGRDNELGRKGDLVWHISADLKHFKELTTGHPVIMGRRTWESLPKRPLPGRLNIVMSRNQSGLEGAVVATDAKEAIDASKGEEAPFVIGGAAIYSVFLPMATVLYLTRIDAESPKDVDTWFPSFDREWEMQEYSEWATDPKGIKYRFETWTRR